MSREVSVIAALLFSVVAGFSVALGADGTPSAGLALPQKKTLKPLPPYEPDGLRVEYSVVLSTPMGNALKSFDPSFALWRQSDYRPRDIRAYPFSLQSTLSAVIGDFNGDGKTDAVLAGRTSRGAAVLVVLSSGSSTYSAIPIQEYSFNATKEKRLSVPTVAGNILYFQPKGKIYELGDMYIKTLILESDAFENAVIDTYDPKLRSYYPSLYWWDGKKFAESGLVDPSK